MSLSTVGSFTIGEISVAASAAVTFFNPLLAQFDLALTGSFGLGALQADIDAQFQAALAAQIDLGLQVSNPLAGFQAALTGLAQVQAGIQAVISLGLPTVSAELSAGVSAQAAIAASLAAKLGGISALLELALSVKVPAVNFLGDLEATLSAGPVFLLSFQNDSLQTTGNNIQAAFAAGLTGASTILPGDTVYGLVLVTKAPAAWAGLQLVFKTA